MNVPLANASPAFLAHAPVFRGWRINSTSGKADVTASAVPSVLALSTTTVWVIKPHQRSADFVQFAQVSASKTDPGGYRSRSET